MDIQNTDKLWQAAMGEFEVVLSKASYSTWLKNSYIKDIADSVATVGVANDYSVGWLKKHFHGPIVDTLAKLSGGVITEVVYTTSRKNGEPEQIDFPLIHNAVEKSATPIKPKTNTPSTLNLNPKYTFENFVVGSSNRLAHAAAEAVANDPGHAYNPLFLYGDVGLGKTHLIQAIAHRVLTNDPTKKIVYVSCEQFTNEFVESLRQGKASQFKTIYRETDLLLVDDIQFIAGKEATQEEFFHTFNYLHQRDRQIIITSDRLPKAIPTLEARLSSRFEMGMIVDINLPDIETRMAIIQSKCEEKKFAIDDKSVAYIAQHMPNNIREIEGAINRLIADCQLNHLEPSEEVVKKILEKFMSQPSQKTVNAGRIIKTTAAYYNIDVDQLTGDKRTKELVYPRQVAMYLLRHEMSLSFPVIGKEIGGRDHTTVMHACEKIEKELSKNEQAREELSNLKERLYTTSN